MEYPPAYRRLRGGRAFRGRGAGDLLTFVFVGGGPTGVEAAADTHELISSLAHAAGRRLTSQRVEVMYEEIAFT